MHYYIHASIFTKRNIQQKEIGNFQLVQYKKNDFRYYSQIMLCSSQIEVKVGLGEHGKLLHFTVVM